MEENALKAESVKLSEIFFALFTHRLYILFSIVISIMIGLLLYFILPKQYESQFSITYNGGVEYFVNSRGEVAESALIKEKEVGAILDRFIAEKKELFPSLNELEYRYSKDTSYPIVITLNMSNISEFEEISGSIVEYLNEYDFVKDRNSSELGVLNEKLDEYVLELDSNNLSNQERSYLEDRVIEMTSRIGSIDGFVYVVKPHMLNSGHAVFPNLKVFISLSLIVGVFLPILIVLGKLWIKD